MNDVIRTADEDDLQLDSINKKGKYVYFSLDGDRALYIGIQEGSNHMELYVSPESAQKLRDWIEKVLS